MRELKKQPLGNMGQTYKHFKADDLREYAKRRNTAVAKRDRLINIILLLAALAVIIWANR